MYIWVVWLLDEFQSRKSWSPVSSAVSASVDKNLSIFLGVNLFNRICKFKFTFTPYFLTETSFAYIYYCNYKKNPPSVSF